MDEKQRRAYLAALGIPLWERRLMSTQPADTESAPGRAPKQSFMPPLPARAQGEASCASAELGAKSQQGLKPRETDGGAERSVQAVLSKDIAATPSQTEDMDWVALASAVHGCHACRLWETRTQVVFGVGDRASELMIIGEAPGADEDAQGEPFVGRAGQLLNRMLKAIGLERDQVYIANVLKCRPPGNRDPRPDEVLACQGYLRRQIELVAPRVILAVGRISAQHLLHTEAPLNRLRGRWFDYGPRRIPLRVTYHPAYLLRSPEQKARAWEDLNAIKHRLAEYR